ncbi:uncharacterized protein LOC134675102 [Cydia fagiglandana]|uniref:uncharacterized protein LOC134675102 n=1 Tax=Cydia fagiglandana TaxID=1458189 RepID=UPI002FEE5BCF
MGWWLVVLSSLVVVSARYQYRPTVINYPKNSAFWATDFFVHGCKTFLDRCAQSYKMQTVCAVSYNDEYRTFPNYCEMQFVNCNSWRNWRIFKREPC